MTTQCQRINAPANKNELMSITPEEYDNDFEGCDQLEQIGDEYSERVQDGKHHIG